MASDRQAPSGTVFDPSPQFWIDKVERNEPPTVLGRCWFAPVVVGMTFDAVASKRSGTWELDRCWLLVEEIHAYGHLIDELNQIVSARLLLSGDRPSGLVSESVLVARTYPSAHWERQGAIWLRSSSERTKQLEPVAVNRVLTVAPDSSTGLPRPT
jgi:hypothetical protein